MKWRQLSWICRAYLVAIYVISLPFAYFCFRSNNRYPLLWLLLTVTSAFVATVSVRLPKISSVISMGDVFTILVLMQFGPGPALVTYWIDILVAHVTDVTRRFGVRKFSRIMLYRFVFNLSCCAISIWSMWLGYRLAFRFNLPEPESQLLGLGAIAIIWFFCNTVTLSFAISLWSRQSFTAVWREGIALYFLNFAGSAAAAGLISLFYDQVGFFVLLLALPIAVVIYQLYLFYIQRFEQAQNHINQLNKVYIQTIEALASAVDAKDQYTHGHIRRVQLYAQTVAQCVGITDADHLMAIRAGALLHDIGKLAIPEYILNKPTALTETEYSKMKIHPVVGANMLRGIEFPYPVQPLVKSHHERWDGRGYPDGLKEEEIPVGARILAVVDCYDALTTNRPYRTPMPRRQLIDFFVKESGRSFDPTIVDALISNLDRLESDSTSLHLPQTSPWDTDATQQNSKSLGRPLEDVQPTRNHYRALQGEEEIQRELFSVFQFARSEALSVKERDILLFMGCKLESLIPFDAAVFFIADLDEGTVVAKHAVGKDGPEVASLTLKLEQKLTGWVAANNQSLTNLPPFPDFLRVEQKKPSFENSCIVPLNNSGVVFGALSIYRKERIPFTDQEFRRAEILASQASRALANLRNPDLHKNVLIDPVTGIGNACHLHLMFDHVAMDADRYSYPVTVIAMRLDELGSLGRRYGSLSVDEVLRSTTRYLLDQLRETDVLIRYADDEFVVVAPRMGREQGEKLISRLQDELDHFSFQVRSNITIPLPMSCGMAIYPQDATKLEMLIDSANRRLKHDVQLRKAVRANIRNIY
jgi:diguanylate cyclase (GGDEF)-like protein/putative nucleotidyltransferase with HDIG domain